MKVGDSHTEQERRNLRLILEVYAQVLSPLDASRVHEFFASDYVQHSPAAADGAEGLKVFLTWSRTQSKQVEFRVKRVFADGDFVIAHVHAIPHPGNRGSALVDIFRIFNGKIVEHWDVVQPIPASAPHRNGMV